MENALFVVCLGAAMCLLTVSSGAAQQGSLEKVCGDLKFPEGPAWDGKGTLYFPTALLTPSRALARTARSRSNG